MEMNTRLQVEHCVTEMRCGLDLVAEQLRVAAGHPLSIRQDQVELRGHAIQCRINAEDPDADFRPSPGRIERWHVPAPEGGTLRVDSHVVDGYVVPPHYDSLIAKVIAWGETREAATATLSAALAGLVCDGVKTTAPMHQQILASDDFRNNRYDTRTIPGFSKPPTPSATSAQGGQ
jgi:acetyl-CoA carboxylase biotin carboxylase subunit